MPIQMKDESMQEKIEDVGGRTLMMQSLLAKMVQETLDENTDDKIEALSLTLDYLIKVRSKCMLTQYETQDDFTCETE